MASKLNLKGLNNKELLLIFNRVDKYFNDLNKNLENSELHKTTFNSKTPEIEVFELSSEDIKTIMDSEYYNTLKSIVDKLEPIIELINEEEPELSKKLNI